MTNPANPSMSEAHLMILRGLERERRKHIEPECVSMGPYTWKHDWCQRLPQSRESMDLPLIGGGMDGWGVPWRREICRYCGTLKTIVFGITENVVYDDSDKDARRWAADTASAHVADIAAIKAVYSTGWIVYRDEESRAKALACANGRYQEALVEGREAWSGSTLRGKAAEWGAAYRRSRQSLLARLRGAGLRAVFVRVGRGHRKVLVVG